VRTWGQLNLIDAASPLQSEIFLFHDHAIVLLLGIFSFVAILGVKLTFNKFTSRTMLEAQRLETIWTIIPALLLLWLALPSLRLLNHGDFRLLEVDNRATVPFQMETSVITTSADVLHAWTLPAIGVKMDAVPGRLNSMRMFVEKPGVYYGQCSEICGANHSFIPIVVEAVRLKDFVNYLEGAE